MAIDEQLILRFQAGDQDAFSDLVNQYRNYISAVTYSATGDFARSEEIAQQAFVIAWQKRDSLREPHKWLAWLRGITRNLLREDYRRRRKPSETRAVSLDNVDEPRSADASPVDNCIDAEQAQLLWSVLENVPENYREPLVLYYRENKSVGKVALLLGLTVDAVKQRLARGRKMLKTEIAQFVEDALQETQPDSRFSAAVLAALPAATAGVSAKVGGSIFAGLFSLKFLAIAAGPLLGIAGAILGSKRSLDQATSDTEKSFIWKMIVAFSILSGGFVTIVLSGTFLFPGLFQLPITQIILWTCYVVLLTSLIAVCNHKLKDIKQRWGTELERADIRRAMSKPVSLPGLRWNMIGTDIGSVIVFFILSGLARDWLFLGLMVISALAIVFWFWNQAPNYQDVPAQIRFNAFNLIAVCLVFSAFAILRWDYWRTLVPFEPNIAGWVIAVSLALFGLLLGGGLMLKANKLENQVA